jgi:hypothetical protein
MSIVQAQAQANNIVASLETPGEFINATCM